MARVLYANTKDSDMFYAVKMDVPDAFFLIDTGKKQYAFLDHREFAVFKEHNTNPNIEVVLVNPFLDKAIKLAESTGVYNRLALVLLEEYDLRGKAIEVSVNFPLDLADFLRSKGFDLKPVSPFFQERLKKTPNEAKLIESAIKRTQEAYHRVEEILTEAKIEFDQILYRGTPLISEFLKGEVDRLLLDQNLYSTEGMIISCGPQAAIPHHRGHGLIRPHQTIICDLFPKDRTNGYFADMTRTYVKGTPTEYIKRMYAAVEEAQLKAIAAVRPGVTLAQVHQASIDTFLKLGFHVGDKGFIHGTGHGLGLDIHEAPYFRTGHTGALEVGNVVTIEPGLYYPEHGGVRIEDVVYVIENGSENLTNYHKKYIIP